MPKQFLEKVKYLCNRIHDVEWSGVLFYSLNGSIRDPKNLEIVLQDILPLDKGTKTFTSYDLDERYIDYVMDNPEVMEWNVGHIHSHNSMGVFFSHTDMEELYDNAPNHNMYLSLIVNNRMDFKAKVATIGVVTQPITYTLNDEKGETYNVSIKGKDKGEALFLYNCNVISEESVLDVPESFMDKVKALFVKKPKTTALGMGMGQQFRLFPEHEITKIEEDDSNEEEFIVYSILSQVCVGYEFKELEDILSHMQKRGIYGNTPVLDAFKEHLPQELTDLKDTQENVEIITGNVHYLVDYYAEEYKFLEKTRDWLGEILGI